MKTFQTLFFLLLSTALMAQFSGYYAPANWSNINIPCSNGYVDAGAAPSSITVVGSDASGCGGNYTTYQIAIPTSGTLSFDWLYTTNDCDGSSFDPFGYSVNGANTQLTACCSFGSQSGSTSISVNAGDVFRFYVRATDDFCGNAVSTISNLNAPYCNLSVAITPPTGPVYYGYAPLSCTVLEASSTGANGAVTYTWSMDGNTSDPGQYATICASSPDCIVVTVMAEDENGCTAEATMLVEVVDVRCFTPSGQQKVELCHNEENNPHTICVSANAVADHLAHGDQLGACGEAPNCGPLLLQQFDEEQIRILDAQELAVSKTKLTTASITPQLDTQPAKSNDYKALSIYPNPTSELVNINISRGVEGKMKISVLNQLGQVVLTSNQVFVKGTPVELNVASLANGQYEVKIELEQGMTYSEKLSILK